MQRFGGAFALLLAGCVSSVGGGDQDGIMGGDYSFQVVVGDQGFMPAILKTENLARVHLRLENVGSKPRGLAIGCLGSACFPADATISPLRPTATATAEFITPATEGIYPISSGVAGDIFSAQFILQ
jgi:hypothetical protein